MDEYELNGELDGPARNTVPLGTTIFGNGPVGKFSRRTAATFEPEAPAFPVGNARAVLYCPHAV